MEWITSLFKISCPFCNETLGDCRNACAGCAQLLQGLETEEKVLQNIRGLQVTSAFSYGDWSQELVLRQKAKPHPIVVRWFADELAKKVPTQWRALPLVWLPGSTFGGLHLVEALALELRKRGLNLARRQYLVRRAWPRKPQKELDVEARRSRDIRELYRPCGFRKAARADREIILLDDVLTTGSTLLGCKRMLEERLELEVRGALTLAYTPKRSFIR
jgi:predicted amidophosphoribosyltransferase